MPTSIWRVRRLSETNRNSLLCVVLLLLSCFPAVSLQAAGDANPLRPNTIALADGALTVRLTHASLPQTLEAVGRLSNAEIVWLQPVGEETVSADFTALPLPEALERLLRGKNFLLFYTKGGKEGKLSQVWISSYPGPKAKRSGHGVRALSAARPTESLQTDHSGEDSAVGEVPLSSLSLDEVVQVAMGERSPALRLDAIALLGQQMHDTPRVKTLLTRIAREDADPAARQIASLTLGDATE